LSHSAAGKKKADTLTYNKVKFSPKESRQSRTLDQVAIHHEDVLAMIINSPNNRAIFLMQK
jgi:hypothetical protein